MPEDGWADLPDELLAKVLELLQAAGQAGGGLGFSQASATVRLVCAGWRAVHDALVTRLQMSPETPEEMVGVLMRRFTAVTSLDLSGCSSLTAERAHTDQDDQAPIKFQVKRPSHVGPLFALDPGRHANLPIGFCVSTRWTYARACFPSLPSTKP
jgi:hypothetical protein